jgi:hypothetical protein
MKKKFAFLWLSFYAVAFDGIASDNDVEAQKRNSSSLVLTLKNAMGSQDAYWKDLSNAVALKQDIELFNVSAEKDKITEKAVEFKDKFRNLKTELEDADSKPDPKIINEFSEELKWKSSSSFETWLRQQLDLANLDYNSLAKIIHQKKKSGKKLLPSIDLKEVKECKAVVEPNVLGDGKKYKKETKDITCENYINVSESKKCTNQISYDAGFKNDGGTFSNATHKGQSLKECGAILSFNKAYKCDKQHSYETLVEDGVHDINNATKNCSNKVVFEYKKDITCDDDHHDCLCDGYANITVELKKALDRLKFYEDNYPKALDKIEAYKKLSGEIQEIQNPVNEMNLVVNDAFGKFESKQQDLKEETQKIGMVLKTIGALNTGREREQNTLINLVSIREQEFESKQQDLQSKTSNLLEENKKLRADLEAVKEQRYGDKDQFVLNQSQKEKELNQAIIKAKEDQFEKEKALLQEKTSVVMSSTQLQSEMQSKEKRIISLIARAFAKLSKVPDDVKPEEKEKFKLKALKEMKLDDIIDLSEDFMNNYFE